jgi:hypothetical protein
MQPHIGGAAIKDVIQNILLLQGKVMRLEISRQVTLDNISQFHRMISTGR